MIHRFVLKLVCALTVFSALWFAVLPSSFADDFYTESQTTERFGFSKIGKEIPLLATFKKSRKPASLEHMIGQMLMLGFKGTDAKDEGSRNARYLLSKGLVGGLIFMGHNVESKSQIKNLISYVKTNAPDGLPPFIAVDQEGGAVQRLGADEGFTDVPEAQFVADKSSPIEALKVYKTLAGELASVGFNVNFGPVVDLNLVPQNPIIGMKGRSFGDDVVRVKAYAKSFISAHRDHQIITSLKHFPGHGSSWTDSHEDFVDLSKSWQRQELAPYKQLINKGLVDMVMVGHLYHPDFSDGAQLPASLSSKAIRQKLRRDIGYGGLVITDDLGMGAIKKHYGFEETIIRALQAGNDILLLVDDKLANREKIKEIHLMIRKAIKEKRLSIAEIEKSYQRIKQVKYGLMKQKRPVN